MFFNWLRSLAWIIARSFNVWNTSLMEPVFFYCVVLYMFDKTVIMKLTCTCILSQLHFLPTYTQLIEIQVFLKSYHSMLLLVLNAQEKCQLSMSVELAILSLYLPLEVQTWLWEESINLKWSINLLKTYLCRIPFTFLFYYKFPPINLFFYMHIQIWFTTVWKSL